MRNVVKALVLTLLSYLMQTCLLHQLRIDGVMGNLLAVNIAILTVSLGRKYAFGASCLTGILVEVMSASVGGLYAVIYPVVGVIFGQIFADMSDERREKKRRQAEKNPNKSEVKDMNPHLRILLNALCIAAGIEAILLVYTSLAGTEISFRLVYRALVAVLYTGVLSLLMFPARAFLGMYGGRIKRAMTDKDQE